jgi:DNA-binding CsgD family transcriptional regulator
MPGRRIDVGRLDGACGRLGEVVVDPTRWIDVMEDVCAAVGATGAGLLQADARTPDVPVTQGGKEVFGSYFRDGLHTCDLRAERAAPLLARGTTVFIDEDLVTPEDIKTDRMYANLIRCGFQWFGAIILHAGPAVWALSIQRTIQEGPFTLADKRRLALLSRPLTEAATLSTAVGRVTLAGATNALNGVRQPAIALDRTGCVLDANPGAAALLDEHVQVKNRRIAITDREASRQFEALIARMAITADTLPLAAEPIVIRRQSKSVIVARVLPVPAAARSPFLGARAIVTFTPVEARPGPCAPLLTKVFGLTPAEANLASLIAEGTSPEAAAAELGIARDTARNQLKAVFAKTDTHRQSELVALLARL